MGAALASLVPIYEASHEALAENGQGTDDDGTWQTLCVAKPPAQSSATGDSDLELIAACRRGDDDAFESLCRRFESRIRGVCWQYLRDPQIIDDLVQETFCKLLVCIPQMDATFNVAGWVYRVATNLCLDELRRVTRHRRFHLTDGPASERATLELVDASRSVQPDEAFDLAMTRDLVRETVRRLPARQRRLLLLRDVDGMSHERIADVLSVPPGTIHGALTRARERFKEIYVALDGRQPRGGECAKVGFAIENLQRSAVRRDRLRSIERHVDACSPCRDRFGPSEAIRFGVCA
jgi:RNA polymerase sigma-70 factor (ECF subfamily)